jgi:putative nucleotidyltransferase with HDIG domain
MSPALLACPTETELRDKRVAYLLSAIAPRLSADTSVADAKELCGAFDEAVEFAACEGKSVVAAITDFLGEDWGPSQHALKDLVIPPMIFVPSKLPVLPRAAADLLRTTDETVTVGELKAIAESDPALTAQLLRTANSALFGNRNEITRILDAVMRIGVPATRKVLLEASFSSLFAGGALREIWEHSQQVASHARQLAHLCGADSDSAYAAGLLHDIGRVAFSVFPVSMQNAERRWLGAGFPLIYSETLAYGSDHAAFGADLLSSWELPEAIVEAVRQHHRPECSRSTLHAVVHLAESAGEDLWSNMRKMAALERTGISREQLDHVLESIC